MLGTLLEKLGGLLPKNFIIAAFFPMLLFAVANGLMAYLTSESFRAALRHYVELDAGKQAFYGFPILIVIAFAAYIFSTLNLSARRALEGESLPAPLRQKLIAMQRTKSDRLEAELKGEKRRWWKLKTGEQKWPDLLDKAWATGRAQSAVCEYSEKQPASLAIDELADKRAQYQVIDAAELDTAVVALGSDLAKCDVGKRVSSDSDYERKELLDRDHTMLREIITYAISRAEDQYATCFNRREFSYSRYKLAPTAMGNVAESVRGYARSRYAINLDPFWLRLQKLVQNDKDFYGSLQDAKTQLDFLVALCWLTIIFTACWLGYLVYLRQSVWLFLAIGAFGPALAWVWYKIAVQNYLAFADVLRTSLDLYRLRLLDELHVNRPTDSEQERQTWARLNQVIGYGESPKIPYTWTP